MFHKFGTFTTVLMLLFTFLGEAAEAVALGFYTYGRTLAALSIVGSVVTLVAAGVACHNPTTALRMFESLGVIIPLIAAFEDRRGHELSC